MGKAEYSKRLGGTVSECSPMLHTQRAAFGAALLCQGDAGLCPVCVQPGALVKSQADGEGAWEQHLAAIQSYLQSCRGVSSGSDVCVPSPGGAQDRDSTWDFTPEKLSSLHHCDKAGMQQGAGTHGDVITHRSFLFSPGQGSRKMWHQWGWSGAKQPRDQQPRVPLLSHGQAEEAQPHHSSLPASVCLVSHGANASVWK